MLLFVAVMRANISTIQSVRQEAGSSSERLLSPREVARRWGIHTITLRRWTKEGRLKSLKLGRSVRFQMEEILRVEDEATV